MWERGEGLREEEWYWQSEGVRIKLVERLTRKKTSLDAEKEKQYTKTSFFTPWNIKKCTRKYTVVKVWLRHSCRLVKSERNVHGNKTLLRPGWEMEAFAITSVTVYHYRYSSYLQLMSPSMVGVIKAFFGITRPSKHDLTLFWSHLLIYTNMVVSGWSCCLNRALYRHCSPLGSSPQVKDTSICVGIFFLYPLLLNL